MVEEGVSPSGDGHSAFEGVGGLHKSFEDEGSDMDCFFPARFEAGDSPSFGFGHVAHPADGAGDFFKVEGCAVNEVGSPFG